MEIFTPTGFPPPERLFAMGGFFFLTMALLSNLSQYLFSSDLAVYSEYNFAWSKVYFCLSMIMGIISLNYLGIKRGWLIKLNPRLSQMHFWLTFAGIGLVLINLDSQLYSEVVTTQNWWDISPHEHSGSIQSLAFWQPNMALSVYLILAGQFIWAGNFLYNFLIGNYPEA
jgi:hypothetical protein